MKKRALLIATLLLVASGTQAQFIASPYYAPTTTATEGLRGTDISKHNLKP